MRPNIYPHIFNLNNFQLQIIKLFLSMMLQILPHCFVDDQLLQFTNKYERNSANLVLHGQSDYQDIVLKDNSIYFYEKLSTYCLLGIDCQYYHGHYCPPFLIGQHHREHFLVNGLFLLIADMFFALALCFGVQTEEISFGIHCYLEYMITSFTKMQTSAWVVQLFPFLLPFSSYAVSFINQLAKHLKMLPSPKVA